LPVRKLTADLDCIDPWKETVPIVFGLVLLAAVAIVLAVYLVPLAYRSQRRKRRIRERERFAAARGWRFTASDQELLRRWRGDPFDRPGDFRKVFGVVHGVVDGRPFIAFDYQRRATSSLRGGGTYDVVTVWALALPSALPPLRVTPAGALARAARNAGTRERKVATGDPEFDRHFTVETPDAELARALLTPALTAWLRGAGLGPWRTEGAWLLHTRDRLTRTTPETLAATAERLAALVARFPAGVWQASP
jgi:hypothetical protein